MFKDIRIKKREISDVLIEWDISSVCNSERRRFNLTKSAEDKDPFIGGHEAIGSIPGEKYPARRYALLPHSNCLTRNDKQVCISCENKTENLCQLMRHAGLDNNEPSGFSNNMYVNRSQLFDVSDIEKTISPFLEPLSCVIRSWELAKCDLKESTNNIAIIGGGPIGCLHALYITNTNNKTNITIVEESLERRNILADILKEFHNINIASNSINKKFDITVMACSSSSGLRESIRLTKSKGKSILFSGFNDIDYKQGNYLPEIIHRYEFTHYTNNILLIGSSGYTQNDLRLSKKHLISFNNPKKIITGQVFGLDSKILYRYDGLTEEYDEPVLIKDIRGDLFDKHIKIQYFNNLTDS